MSPPILAQRMEYQIEPPRIGLTGSDRIWIVLSHLSPLLGVPFLLPLVVYLVMRNESPIVANNAREALNFHISLIIYVALCFPLTLILIGIPLLFVISIGSLILSIVAAVKGSDGVEYHYPACIRLIH